MSAAELDAGWRLGEPVFTARLLENPYPCYHRIRAETPAYLDARSGERLVTRYRDVSAILKHPQFSSRGVVDYGIPVPKFFLGLMRPVRALLANQMLFSDPPDHTRLRGLANRAFTPRVVQTMQPRIQQIADELLDRAERRGSLDVVQDYAVWLPLLVVAELLGVPTKDRKRFKTWSDDLALFVGGSTLPLPLILARAGRGVFHLRQYFRGLVRKRRSGPAVDDLLGALLIAEERGDSLTEDELLANAILLLAAGHETTANLIGNGTLALLRHPDQLALLRSEPELMDSAVTELLRYDSPVQWSARRALEDVDIGGFHVPARTSITLGLGAANRDPAQFPEPDRLDLRRGATSHLAFGSGIHFCLGAALARLEGQIALGTLLARYPDLRLTDTRPQWQKNFTLRGMKSLRVAVR
ncbi:MAG: cytochrome P450 [Actinomycetota bacterium]